MSLPTAIEVFPDPVLARLGALTIAWYGICYAVGLLAMYVLLTRESRRRGLDPTVVDRAILVVGVATLVGARAYHVIDEWDRYSDDLWAIVRPPYSGLGVLGGIATGALALVVVMRVLRQSFWHWADVVAPAAFVLQGFARWGNFFNQELYGRPTDVPWAIAIDCAHRVPDLPCSELPVTAGFHPLFAYESLSGFVGAAVLLAVARRWGHRLRPGDLFLAWLVWYSLVRLAVEPLRVDRWTTGGVPTATLVSGAFVVAALALAAWRHRPGSPVRPWSESGGAEPVREPAQLPST